VVAGIVALVWQAILAGHALWLVGSAAREAARAAAIRADPLPAARRVLPGRLARTVEVAKVTGDAVRVRIEIPSAVGIKLGRVSATARLEPQR
jgi:hypothetical protein